MSIGVISCPEHGALYFQPGVGPGSRIETVLMVALRDDLPMPVAGDEMVCPLCFKRLEVGLVPDGSLP